MPDEYLQGRDDNRRSDDNFEGSGNESTMLFPQQVPGADAANDKQRRLYRGKVHVEDAVQH